MPTGRLIGIACGHGAGGDPGSVPVYVFFHGTKGRLSSHLYADMYFDFVPFDSAVQEARKRTVLFVFLGPLLLPYFRIHLGQCGKLEGQCHFDDDDADCQI